MNYDSRHDEEEIDLLYVLAMILRKWRWLVAWVVAGALLLGGYRLIKPAEPKVDEEAVTALQTAIDANKAALTANETELQNNVTNTEANHGKIAANEEALVTYRESQETLQGNLDALIQGLERAESVLANPVATVSQTSSVIVQLPTLTNDINEANNAVLGAANQVKAAEGEITTWQTEIANMAARTEQLTAANEQLRVQLESQEAEIAELKKGEGGNQVFLYIVLGALLGAVLHCVAVLVWSMLNHDLRTAEELHSRYDLPILGEFLSESGKQHTTKYDKFLDKLTGDKQTVPEDEGVYELIAAGICAGTEAPVNLVVTGTVKEEELQEVAMYLKEKLPEGYEVSGKRDPAYNAEFLADIRDYKVVLVEKKGISGKPEIDKLAELLIRNNVTVLGAVVR